MNILNKLNQADRKKIEKRLKREYRYLYGDMEENLKKYENADGEDKGYKMILLNNHIAFCAKINGMHIVMDIFGIDYSDWKGKI